MSSAILKVKVVPGSSRDAVVGMLGDALKVKVAAAPEGGKANQRVCGLLAEKLKVGAADVEVASGTTSAHKTLRISGLDQDTLNQRVRELLGG